MKKLILIAIILFSKSVFCQQFCEDNFCLFFDDSVCLQNVIIDTGNNPENVWQIGKIQKSLFDTATLQNNTIVIVTDTINPYPVNNHSEFIIRNAVSMGDFYGLKNFSGSYNVNSDSLNDFGTIEFSPDNGISWIDLINDTIYSTNFIWNSPKPILTGNSGGWRHFELMLADLGSVFTFEPSDTILYRFSFTSDSVFDNRGGLMFDDICFYDFIEGVTEIRILIISRLIFTTAAANWFLQPITFLTIK